MEESKYAPEPWRVVDNHNADYDIIDVYGRLIMQGWHKGLAARIVACVNHCKGATNEELELTSHEQLVQRFENEARDLGIAENEIRQLKAQRDELLMMLLSARSLIIAHRDGHADGAGITAINIFLVGLENLVINIHSAAGASLFESIRKTTGKL